MNDGAYRIALPLRAVLAIACAAMLLIALFSPAALAASATLFDGRDGVTCDYFNLGARVHWRHRLGDWMDRDGASQGEHPFAQQLVKAADANRIVAWDVTTLVQGWIAGEYRNHGLALVGLPASDADAAVFHSREAADSALRPRLVLTLADGRIERVSPVADASLDCSTFGSLGALPTLKAGPSRRVALQFDLTAFKNAPAKAMLELTTTSRQFGNTPLGVFRLDPPLRNSMLAEQVQEGIAARYALDHGIEKDPSVIMATGFDSASWRSDWSYDSMRSSAERVIAGAKFGFEPLDGHALQVKIPAGENLGLDMGYKFADKLGHEPEEVYFRYYLRLASDWRPGPDGGKLPGLSATYGRTGWGGRKADGTTGWSMRGSFYPLPAPGSPYHELTPVGTYAYHADMEEDFGDAWDWTGGGRELLERNRWYCVEQYFKVNQLGRKDGVLRVWIDGYPVYERTGIRVRDVPSIRIEQVWMNVYYGGTGPSPVDLHLFIDNVVIARKYIGPVGR